MMQIRHDQHDLCFKHLLTGCHGVSGVKQIHSEP
jgi:hypothetical protein